MAKHSIHTMRQLCLALVLLPLLSTVAEALSLRKEAVYSRQCSKIYSEHFRRAWEVLVHVWQQLQRVQPQMNTMAMAGSQLCSLQRHHRQTAGLLGKYSMPAPAVGNKSSSAEHTWLHDQGDVHVSQTTYVSDRTSLSSTACLRSNGGAGYAWT